MRKVALDLGKRQTTYCEVSDGEVVQRATVSQVQSLETLLGPDVSAQKTRRSIPRRGSRNLALLKQPAPGRQAIAQPVLPPLHRARQRHVLGKSAVTRLNVRSLTALISVLLLACRGQVAPSSESTTGGGAIRAANIPPSAKDVVNAALESAMVPLGVHESCKGVGTEPTDATLGRFLSGFMVELNPEIGKNGLVTSVRDTDDGWVCRFMIQHRAGEDVWNWGLEFKFGKDGTLIPTSYRCIGAG